MSLEEQILERLAKIEEKLDRSAALEEQLGDFGRAWESLSDLGRDLSLLVGPSATLVTEELAEVETGFQLEDVSYLIKRLLLSFRHIAWSLEQLENLIDWWQDMEPLLKIAVPHLVDKLDDLEQKGIFKINAAMLDMYGKIAQHYTPEDIATIGDGFVRVHGLVKKFSDPDFINFIEKLTDIPMEIDLEASQPVGPVGLVFRMQNQECRQGLGVMVELTRALGKIKNGRAQSVSPST
jgi:uncharacterized protein YjgD (DUF1641 family)